LLESSTSFARQRGFLSRVGKAPCSGSHTELRRLLGRTTHGFFVSFASFSARQRRRIEKEKKRSRTYSQARPKRKVLTP
jgi:hypothetical protein